MLTVLRGSDGGGGDQRLAVFKLYIRSEFV